MSSVTSRDRVGGCLADCGKYLAYLAGRSMKMPENSLPLLGIC